MVFQYEVMSLGGKPDGVCFLDTLVWRGFRHVVYTHFMVPFFAAAYYVHFFGFFLKHYGRCG